MGSSLRAHRLPYARPLRPSRRESMRVAPRTIRTAALALAAWAAAACATAPAAPPAAPACFPTFPYEQGWLGGDGAYSVALSPTRTLWLFGDTFVGSPEQQSRDGATFIHNSIGISECDT